VSTKFSRISSIKLFEKSFRAVTLRLTDVAKLIGKFAHLSGTLTLTLGSMHSDHAVKREIWVSTKHLLKIGQKSRKILIELVGREEKKKSGEHVKPTAW
jgi:hypothetical protein